MSFLTAKWINLALINYSVDPESLKKYVPEGTELDLWNNTCYLSLVGFLFDDVKLKGLKIPFHTQFEEVNLRFYVKRFENGEWKRGVVFLKEIVPKPAVTLIANIFYGEHYQTLPMKHSVTPFKEKTDFVYQWKTNSKWNTLLVETNGIIEEIGNNSEAEFITEHYFGYTQAKNNKTTEYEVKHPKWKQYQVTQSYVDVNFEETYGKEFSFLNDSISVSAFLALGSTISVENKKTIV